MTDAEIDALAAKESAPPAALTDADIDRLSATTMPKQTGKRFIEPPDDEPAPAGPTFNDTAAQIQQARAALGQKIDTSPLGLAKQAAVETGQGFKNLAQPFISANNFAANTLSHPVDTASKIAANPAASARVALRGIDANIPFANRAVDAIPFGRIPETPEQDAANVPEGLGDFASVAAMPGVGKMVGGIAAKGLEAAVPVVSKAAGRIGEAAEARQAARVIDEAKVDATKTLRSNIKVATPRIEAVLTSDPDLTARLLKTRGKPDAMNHILTGELESTGKQIGAAYADADTVALGAPLEDVRRALHGAARSYNNPADKPLKDQITRLIDNFDEQFSEGGRVPLSKLWETRQSLARRGFAGSVADPTVQKELQRDAASAIQSVINKRFGEINELSSNIAKSPGLSEASGPLQQYAARTAAIDRVPDLNKRFSALQTMQDAVEYKVNSDSEKKGFNLMNLFGHGHKAETAGAGIGAAAGAAAGHATGIPGAGAIGGVIGGAVGKRVGYAAGGIPAAADTGLTRVAQSLSGITAPPPQVAARSATALAYSSALDRLADMARTQPPAQFIDAAVRAGLPRVQAQAIAAAAQRPQSQVEQ